MDDINSVQYLWFYWKCAEYVKQPLCSYYGPITWWIFSSSKVVWTCWSMVRFMNFQGFDDIFWKLTLAFFFPDSVWMCSVLCFFKLSIHNYFLIKSFSIRWCGLSPNHGVYFISKGGGLWNEIYPTMNRNNVLLGMWKKERVILDFLLILLCLFVCLSIHSSNHRWVIVLFLII